MPVFAVLDGAQRPVCAHLRFLAALMPFFMQTCLLNVGCLREIHVRCLHLRSLAGTCWRTCALLHAAVLLEVRSLKVTKTEIT